MYCLANMISYKNIFLVLVTLATLLSCTGDLNANSNNVSTMTTSLADFYSLGLLSANGKDSIKLSDFKGKKILIVNVASECGYTPQYKDLQALSEKYAEKLVIIGFPCNQFGGQEPGTEDEIVSFCQKNYGVTFPISQKGDVKGAQQHPLYQWLTQKSMNGKDDYSVKWNFNKFLISETGELLSYFPSSTKPLSEDIESYLK